MILSNTGSLMTLAYIDPGTGAMLLQWLLAGVIGASFYFRRFVSKVLRRIIGKKDPDVKDPQQNPPKTGEET
jgi:hypothetical protein